MRMTFQVSMLLKVVPASSCEPCGASPAHAEHQTSPTLFIGERQLLWIKHWIKGARRAPVFISQANRLREFKAPARAKDPTAKSLPRLLDDLQVNAIVKDLKVGTGDNTLIKTLLFPLRSRVQAHFP